MDRPFLSAGHFVVDTQAKEFVFPDNECTNETLMLMALRAKAQKALWDEAYEALRLVLLGRAERAGQTKLVTADGSAVVVKPHRETLKASADLSTWMMANLPEDLHREINRLAASSYAPEVFKALLRDWGWEAMLAELSRFITVSDTEYVMIRPALVDA